MLHYRLQSLWRLHQDPTVLLDELLWELLVDQWLSPNTETLSCHLHLRSIYLTHLLEILCWIQLLYCWVFTLIKLLRIPQKLSVKLCITSYRLLTNVLYQLQMDLVQHVHQILQCLCVRKVPSLTYPINLSEIYPLIFSYRYFV